LILNSKAILVQILMFTTLVSSPKIQSHWLQNFNHPN